MTTASTHVDGRRQRGAVTRETLRAAAIACLVERGFAGTTTAEISARAGVSPGLFVRHFGTKIGLLADAVGRAQRRGFERLAAQWAEGGHTAHSPEERVRAALAQMLDLYDEPEMRCLAELELAARTDPDLAAALQPVLTEVDRFIVEGSRRLAPETRIGPTFDDRVRAVVDMARGLAIRSGAMTPEQAGRARAAALEVLGDLLELDR